MARGAKLVALNALVCLALGAAGLAALELWLRLTIPASSGGSIYEYTLDTPRFKRMKPNAAVVAWGEELRTNQLGFRDDEPELAAKRPGERRIVVLGDSFTVSAGVAHERIYTSLVERELRRRHPGTTVVNLAVGGYNVVQYGMVLEEVGLGLQPDALLVALYLENDFSMATYELNRRVAAGLEPEQPRQRWYEALYVYRAYVGRVVARFVARPKEDVDDGWQPNLAALQAIAETARSRGIPLGVALLPSTWHLERQGARFDRVRALCREHSLSCLDLLRPMAQEDASGASLRLNALDAHPSAKYNAIVARLMTPYVEQMLLRAPQP